MVAASPVKTGRNAPCECGSGKKYKHCCLPKETHSSTRSAINTIAEALQLALSYHQRGELEQAEAIYRQILQVEPEHPDALHLLGLVTHQSGDQDGGIALLRRAIDLNPGISYYYNNLANMLRERSGEGDVAEAIPLYHEAIRLQPDYAEAFGNLGLAFEAQGDQDSAATSYAEAVRLRPDNAETHFNLGNILRIQGSSAEAAAHYQDAIRLRPAYSEAHNNLGIVLREQGALVDAISSYREAVRLQPDFAGAYNNLGMALHEHGDISSAIAQYRESLRLQPENADAYSNLGIAQHVQGNLPAAVESFQAALRIRPDFAEAFNNLAVVLHAGGDLIGAIEQCRAALRLKPDYVEAASNLMYQLQMVCDWSELEATWVLTKELMRADASPAVDPFTLLVTPTTSEEQLAFAQRWATNRLDKVRQLRDGLDFHFFRSERQRLRVGYLSADYHEHATAYLIAELFELHDRERFEVIAYSIGRDDGSAMRQRLVAGCDRFVDLYERSFVEAAQQIYADGIDILVDLKGYTRGCRTEILALQPAPIQVSYLGYPGTMGAEFIDYVLTDRFVTPPAQQAYFTEQFAYLPDCYQVNDRQRPIAEQHPSREACGLPAEGLVFCSFAYSVKITKEVFAIWMRLLEAVPGSVLWLLESNRWVADNLRREAAARGIDSQRLVFARHVSLSEHLARHQRADLLLDTFPYNSHTTASDALWVGVPVVTCAGETFVSRVAGSLVQAIGLPELVTSSLEEYEQLARRLAQQPAELAEVKQRLAENRVVQPLFATERFTTNLEATYRSMWESYVS